MDRTLKFRLQRSADDTLECFDSLILTMLASRGMANFVSQEAYEPQGHVINLFLICYYARLVLVAVVWFIYSKVSCSCGHRFVDKHLLTPSRKHIYTLCSFRAIETVKKLYIS